MVTEKEFLLAKLGLYTQTQNTQRPGTHLTTTCWKGLFTTLNLHITDIRYDFWTK